MADGFINHLFESHPVNYRQHFALVTSADERRVMAWGASRLAIEGCDHAEENAIKELASRNYTSRQLRNLTMIVARKHNDRLRLSKPCVDCCKAIKISGVFQWVCYSTADGVYERVRVRDLHSQYISIGRRHLLTT